MNDAVLKKAKTLHDKLMGKQDTQVRRSYGCVLFVAFECECRMTVGSNHPTRRGHGTSAGSNRPARSLTMIRGRRVPGDRVRVEASALSVGSMGTRRAIAPTSDGTVSSSIGLQIVFV